MFSCLRPVPVSVRPRNFELFSHLTITSSDDNNSAIHIGSTSNHVLDIIGVTRAVDVRVMTVGCFVFDVSGGDGDAALSLFGRLVNGAIVEIFGEALLGLSFGDGSSQRGLGMLDALKAGSGSDIPCRDQHGRWYLRRVSIFILRHVYSIPMLT